MSRNENDHLFVGEVSNPHSDGLINFCAEILYSVYDILKFSKFVELDFK